MKIIGRAALALIAICACISAYSQSSAREFDLKISRQPIVRALNELSEQTGIQIGYFAASQDSMDVGPLVGRFSVEAAIQQLLPATGYTFQRTNDRTIAIFGPAASTEKLRKIALQEPARKESRPRARVQAQPIGNDNGDPVETVVVTAQKREERLQDVPISIAVLGGNELDSSTARGVTESLARVPGVMAQESYIGGGTQVAIRGVAASGPVLLGSSPIAYYLDSVPFGLINAAIAPDANAYDMQRVEVLRGPQGTLYGSSALNGVVRVLTNDADLNRLEGKARGSISSTKDGGENYRGDMALNVPLIEGKLAARAVVGYESLSGWIDRPNEKDANDADLSNVRLKVNARPTDALTIGLSAWISRADYGAPPQSREDRRHASLAEEPMNTDYDAYGLKVGYDVSNVSITSMTSYLEYDNRGSLDLVPWIGFDTDFVTGFNSELFSEEVVLNADIGSAWRVSLGGIYRDATDNVQQLMDGLFAAPVDYDVTSESFAIYGELTRRFLDGRLELTGGLRYFEDDVRTAENTPSTGVPSDALIRDEGKFDAVTPRVVLTWHASPDVTAYASYAEGFRSGFQQQPNVLRVSPNLAPVDADSLKNYEIGTKASTMQGRLTFDAAVYYIDWQDVQNQFGVNLPGGVVLGALANSGSASGAGVDFALSAQPVDGLQLALTVGWNDLSWDKAVPYSDTVLFEAGARLNLSPEYTAGALIDYAFPLTAGGLEARISASGNYTSEQEFKTNFGHGVSDNILVARTSFAVESQDGWAATLYVDNLTDEDGAVVVPPFGVPDWTLRMRPRTVGVQLEYRY